MKFSVLLFICLFSVAFQGLGQNKVTDLKKEKFKLNKAGEDQIGYTQAIRVGNTIYVSGSVGWGKMEDALKIAYDEIDKTLKNLMFSQCGI